MTTHNLLMLLLFVADVDAQKHVDDSLEEIWILKFGQDMEAKFWSWFRS